MTLTADRASLGGLAANAASTFLSSSAALRCSLRETLLLLRAQVSRHVWQRKEPDSRSDMNRSKKRGKQG